MEKLTIKETIDNITAELAQAEQILKSVESTPEINELRDKISKTLIDELSFFKERIDLTLLMSAAISDVAIPTCEDLYKVEAESDCTPENVIVIQKMYIELLKRQMKNIFGENNKIEVYGAALLSADEVMILPERLRLYKKFWWVRDPGVHHNSSAAFCHKHVKYDISTNAELYVRPALSIGKIKNAGYKIGDTFNFGGCEFEIVTENLAFCKTDIKSSCFRKNLHRKYSGDIINSYEASDVKKYIENWFDKNSDSKAVRIIDE